MTEKPEASVLTARRAAQHFRLSSADDACEHLYILIVRSSLGPSPPNAGRYTVASRFRRRSCERGYIFPRAPEQFVASPLCLVGYVRWDARSDRVPPLQTIIFSSFPGRTKGCRPYWSYREPARIEIPSLPDWRKTRLLDVQCGPLGNSKWKSLLEIQHYPISETACRQTETSTVGPSVFRQILRRKHVPTHFGNGSDRGPAVRRYQFRRNPQPCHHSVRFVR